MKILMLTSGTPNSRMSYRIVALGKELIRLGHDVTMIAPSFDRHSGWKVDRPNNIDGIKMVYPPQLQTRFYLANLVPYILGASFEVMRRNADIVYLYKPTPVTIVGLIAKLIRRTPIVLDMDDLGSEVMRAEGRSGAMSRLVEMCEELAAGQATAIVAASRLLENEYHSKYPTKPILRLPNGVDPMEITPARSSRKRHAKIIFFGILGRPAILASLIRALPEVIREVGRGRVQVEILGDGPARTELEQLAERLGVSDVLTFRGWTTFDQLTGYATAGDVAICTTPQERTTAACSNQKIFQYMALSLATIVTDVGDLPLYVEDGEAGLVVPADDPEALAKAMVYLLRRPSIRQHIGEFARNLAETKYAWTNLALTLNQLLETVR